jgi:hypothetical protein
MGAVLLTLSLAACRDAADPGATMPATVGASASSAAAAALTDTTVDFFSADVAIDTRMGLGAGKLNEYSRTNRFHVERRRRADGVWISTYTFAEPDQRVFASGGRTPPGIARLEMADDGSSLRAFDRAGNPVDMEAGIAAAERLAAESGQGRGFPERPDRGRGLARRPRQAQPWTNEAVSTPHGRAAQQESLRRRFGAPQGRVNGLDRYAAQRGDHMLEVLVDPATGLVMEQNMASAGKLTQHVTYAYADLGGGVYVRNSARAEFEATPAADGKKSNHVVIEYTLSNVRAEKRGRNE